MTPRTAVFNIRGSLMLKVRLHSFDRFELLRGTGAGVLVGGFLSLITVLLEGAAPCSKEKSSDCPAVLTRAWRWALGRGRAGAAFDGL